MIRFENVGMQYDDDPEIFSDINFNLPQGSFTFLTGPSGAGKTSLLRLIFLAAQPSRGKVFLFDEDTSTLARQHIPLLRRQIGIVFQEFRLLEHLSIYENVALPLRVMGEKQSDYRDNIIELLQWVGLGEKVSAAPSTLSGGEQQRAAIARAVVARPKLIIADEPTGNVDPEMGTRLMRLFIELNKLGTSVIIATHDQHLWRQFDFPRLHLSHGQAAYLNHVATNGAAQTTMSQE